MTVRRRVHWRSMATYRAEAQLRDAVDRWIQDRGELTSGEYLLIINRVFSDLVSSQAQTQIRWERHGDSDQPGG